MLIRGASGLRGGALALFIVVIFLAAHLAVSKVSTKLDPMMTLVLAMISYFTKLLVLGAFLLLITKLTAPTTFDRKSFAVVACAITFAWLAGEIRAFLKLKLHMPLPVPKGEVKNG